jgi:SIR2-like domain
VQAASDAHLRSVLSAMKQGRLTPFLGAGVNLVGRPEGELFAPGRSLPSGGELARYLAELAGYEHEGRPDLARVTQWIAVMEGSGPLYTHLHEVFDGDFPITPVHDLLAEVPGLLRERHWLPWSGAPHYPLIVTTNYDDVLERAFEQRGEPFDLVWYAARGGQPGRFLHRLPDGDVRTITVPNEYRDVRLTERCAILKIHGAVSRTEPLDEDARSAEEDGATDSDSYVITEDDYITFLAQADISGLVPVTLAGKLRKSNFLFLGYGLRDWNLRVILHRIWSEQAKTGTYSSWAIQLAPEELDEKFWSTRNVEVIDVRLEDYLEQLRGRLLVMPSKGES